MMNSAVCTLFEGNYHYGVAALVNSLCYQGYQGNIYTGYRGALPSWSAEARENADLKWPGSRTLHIREGLYLHFLPLHTDYHFTNYKPDFMLRLWDTVASGVQAMFYFDPDIVVNAPWSVFEEWTKCGVALCEDVNSPKAMHHPIREAWRSYFGAKGFELSFKEATYANGGFVGVSEQDRSFLTRWQALQEAMAPAIGGLERSAFASSGPLALPASPSPFLPFNNTDQDALNATVEAWDGVVSFVDKSGMAFITSASLMSHAIGGGKPWNRNAWAQLAAGHPPRRVDRDYWDSANGPIMSQPRGRVRREQLVLKIAALIGRFYSRN